MVYPPKGEADYLELGDWNAVCFRCGRKQKAGWMMRQWQGYWVCPEHWEARQPQDFVRAVRDVQTPPWTQPEGEDVFVPMCGPQGLTAIPNQAIPNCVFPNNISPAFIWL